jgi:hypothetical protein
LIWQLSPWLMYDFIFAQVEDLHCGLTQREACSIRVMWSWIFRWRSLRFSSVRPLLLLDVDSTLSTSSLWLHVPLLTLGFRKHSSQRSKSEQVVQWCLTPDRISRAHEKHCWTSLGASRFCKCHNTIIDVCLARLSSSNW